MTGTRESRLAAIVVALTTGICYLGTLAPSVTLWDAGEFASSVATFGVPHPPGTPLYITIARAFTRLLAFVPVVRATNLLSAACTVAACAIIAALVARWTSRALDGIAAGALAGLMTSVWLNANETEVYAASLLLSALMLLAANVARRLDDERATLLVVYLFALAVPLHLSALVASPGAIALASIRQRDGASRIDRVRVLQLTGAAFIAGGAGVVSPWPALAGALLLASAVIVRDERSRRARLLVAVGAVALIAVALSSLAIMLVRARFDPAINQGNPSTVGALLDVVARKQYAVPGLWPRRAPVWLQVANLFEYFDWQGGLALTPDAIGASWLRTPITAALFLLGVVGARAHRRRDVATFAAMAVLVVAATIGVVAYLNLQAGPSIGYGILPPTADHEARERDYFFALGFAAWGAWAGLGFASIARHVSPRRDRWLVALFIAAMAASSWRAVDRSHDPRATLPGGFARALLESAPINAVLFVAGDNDTYPVWYVQRGEHVRGDVTTITIPLLPADWYRAELARRYGLMTDSVAARWRGESATVRDIALRASAAGRTVAASVAVEPAVRRAIDAGAWSMSGLVYVALGRSPSPASALSIEGVAADTAAVRRGAALVERLVPEPRDASRFTESAERYVASLLDCPALALEALARGGNEAHPRAVALLDSRCNLR